MLSLLLNKVLNGSDLTEREISEALGRIMDKSRGEILPAAFLTALRMKGETLPELIGAARFLRFHARSLECPNRELLDTCGTGGDDSSSFNISTTAAFVASGAGVRVAKHGNSGISSRCGSADLLAALGYPLDAPPQTAERCLELHGIAFLFARNMHPVLASAAGLRKELGFRTIFNMLGPLCNPAGAEYQVTGVYDGALTELFAAALRELGTKRAMIVHGNDGLDEISVSDTTRISELNHGRIRTYEFFPELYLGRTFPPEEIRGGDARENARITLSVLEGKDRGARRAVTLLNAAAAIRTAGIEEDMTRAIARAEESVDSGAAREKLELLIREARKDV